MFRKPDAIQYWHRDYPAECAARQKVILQAAIKCCRLGGSLIYSTCTFSPEEDEQIIIAWLLAHYDLTLEPIEMSPGMVAGRPEWTDDNPELTKTARLFPHLVRGEGHFVAKLRLAGELPNEPVKPLKIKPLVKAARGMK